MYLSLALIGCADIEERCGESYDTGGKATVKIECDENPDNSTGTIIPEEGSDNSTATIIPNVSWILSV